jgi:tetratricopeptide (TPR) repeat protein
VRSPNTGDAVGVKLRVGIRPTEAPQRTATAWFLAGDDSRAWLEELSRWQIPLDGVRLYLIPRSAADRRPSGVLVVPPPGVAPVEIVRAQGYGTHSPRLYLPVNARFDPPVTEREIEDELLNPIAVWHPIAGLVGFDESDALGVANLLAPPVERTVDWDLARPGTAPPPRLMAVLPPEPPAVQQALAEWRDDIGGKPPDELPPAPNEPSESPLGRAGRQAKRALAKLALKLTALAPRTATSPTWINRVEEWARRQAAALGSSLDAARHKEINRLLHLLDTNPEQGLRHALPLGSGAHRGEGTPGARLGTRDLDFRLDQLGGSGPADPWNVDGQQQSALRRRYRELANREVQLGRHRRAAYIFAHLLDDVTAAADALEQGGHDREAAILYRERLARPLDAARCLERCGAWDEAVEIYAERNEFEKAAELLARLDRSDEATGMYRRAVERWTRSGNPCRAAKLLEEKLEATDEAADLLAAAWPTSSQSDACLSELFSLFGRHARHDEAQRWVARLRGELHSPRQLGEAVTVLAQVAHRYPDAAARQAAADVTRVLVGNRLPMAAADEAASLVHAVRSLVPQDDLLGRDAARWLARQRHPPAARPRVKYGPPQRQATIVQTHSFRLPAGVTYKTAVASLGGLIAAGFAPVGVAVVSSAFSETISRMDWNIPLADLRPLLLAPHNSGWPVLVALVGGPTLGNWSANGFGTPSWFTQDMLAAAASSLGVWWTIDNGLLLTAVREDGRAFSSRQFSLAELGVRAEPRDEPPEHLAVMLARRDDVYLGLGHTLVAVKNDRVEQTQLKGWVRQLVAAPLVLQLRLAAGFEDYGAAVIWDDMNGRDVLEIAISLQRPELTFTLDGLLVAADHNEGRVYSTSNRGVALRGRFTGPRRALAGLVCGGRPGEFWLVTQDGEVIGYRID